MTFGSLFAGIGGFDLGFERAGLKCEWQVEIDPFARKVLAKHWPDVRRHDDVRTFPPEPVEDWRVDVICGGFPCQDISYAGSGAGLDGERSGLWSEIVRTVRLLRPRYVVVENVAALLTRGMDRVLGDVASLGFDAEWGCIPAAAVGAPHLRDRVFVVAHDASRGQEGRLVMSGHGREAFEQARRLRGLEERVEAWGRDMAPVPVLVRAAHGLPDGMDRRRGLGNAVVPQVAEWIGRRLLAACDSS